MERVHSHSGELLTARAFSIQSCVGMLHQNKRVDREEALADLVAALEGFVRADDIADHRYEQALDRCFSFLGNGGSAKERKAAYRAIGIYALTVGSSKAQVLLDRLFDLDSLSGMAPSSASDAERAVAAVNCLAAVTLVSARTAADAKRPLKAVLEVIDQTASPHVLAAALAAWTLLLPKAASLRAMAPFKVIAKHLGADDRAVRMAAGEALAVCVELNHLPHQPDPPPTYYYRRYTPPEPKPEDRPLLESRVAELAAGADVLHKKEHAEEAVLFRQIKDLLEANPAQAKQPHGGPVEADKPEGGPCPDKSWSWSSSSGCRVKVRTWAKLVQLNFLRQYFGEEGFAAHFQLNRPLFRDTLGLNRAAGGAEEEDILTSHEKRQLRNDSDKQRTKDINKDRRNKNTQY